MNKRQNKCGSHLECYNLDGRHCSPFLSIVPHSRRPYSCREFILRLLERGICFDEVIMNLPQSALTFLDVFVGLLTRRYPDKSSPPLSFLLSSSCP